MGMAERSLARTEMVKVQDNGFLQKETHGQMFGRLYKMLNRLTKEIVSEQYPEPTGGALDNILLASHKDVVITLLPMWQLIAPKFFVQTAEGLALRDDVFQMDTENRMRFVDQKFREIFGGNMDYAAHEIAPPANLEGGYEMGCLSTINHEDNTVLKFKDSKGNEGYPSEDGNTPVAPAYPYVASSEALRYKAPDMDKAGNLIGRKPDTIDKKTGNLKQGAQKTPLIIAPRLNYYNTSDLLKDMEALLLKAGVEGGENGTYRDAEFYKANKNEVARLTMDEMYSAVESKKVQYPALSQGDSMEGKVIAGM